MFGCCCLSPLICFIYIYFLFFQMTTMMISITGTMMTSSRLGMVLEFASVAQMKIFPFGANAGVTTGGSTIGDLK